MSGARFVRFYPSDWRSGCIGMTMEQEGFYVRVCAFIYETNRRLPLCDTTAAKFIGVHTNAYRKVRDQLVELGKLRRHEDGFSVDRAELELVKALGYGPAGDQEGIRERQTDADTGGETPEDTLGDTHPNTPTETPTETPGVFPETSNKNNRPSLEPIANSQSEVPPKAPKGAAMPILEAFELWNTKALELGLPQAATLSPARRRSIGARLREAGGLDGWRKMLAEVARSSFLLGRKDGCDFRADLDFVLKPSRFPKILDGGYADKDAPAASSAPWWQDPSKVAGMTPDRWRRGIDKHANGKWPILELGPWPGDPKCLVPRELIDELHLTDKYDPRTGLAKGEWAAEQRKRHEAHA